MVNHLFFRLGRRDTEEEELDRARRLLREMGVSMFPDGMLSGAVHTAPVLGSGTYGTCYRVQVYSDSRLVDAAVKVFHKKTHLHHVLHEALNYTRLAGVPRVPHLLGVSLRPLSIVTTLHGPETLLDTARQACVPVTDLLRALHQVAATLLDIHDRRLVHNDLKYDNLLISRTPESADITTTLVDMGAVQSIGARPYYGRRLSAEKYPYLAPEVLGGGPVSPCSDAFSLGWMLRGVLFLAPSCSRAAQGLEVARQCMHPDPGQRLSVTAFQEAITNLFLNSP